ncbi:hypothetical protein EC973_008125 [Apophysomyces ossiformis]|uniref:Uncharacterized protein n=1 Tax=Apophysomyces ossiformis TaxID=679940 RepID=A0A8H7ER78_9FUNG|nr:hypothetical protein EC973_008125 [Apophysomyces ossiformis]
MCVLSTDVDKQTYDHMLNILQFPQTQPNNNMSFSMEQICSSVDQLLGSASELAPTRPGKMNYSLEEIEKLLTEDDPCSESLDFEGITNMNDLGCSPIQLENHNFDFSYPLQIDDNLNLNLLANV